MMRYFFHTPNAFYARDLEGIDLIDVDRARVEAVKFAAQIMLDSPELVCGQGLRVEVTDQAGSPVFQLVTTRFDAAPPVFAADEICDGLDHRQWRRLPEAAAGGTPRPHFPELAPEGGLAALR